MSGDDDFSWNGEAASVEELEANLKRCDVTRGLRRLIVRDARRFNAALEADGVPAERRAFRVSRCECCGEVTLWAGDGRRRYRRH